MIETRRLKNVVILFQTTQQLFLIFSILKKNKYVQLIFQILIGTVKNKKFS